MGNSHFAGSKEIMYKKSLTPCPVYSRCLVIVHIMMEMSIYVALKSLHSVHLCLLCSQLWFGAVRGVGVGRAGKERERR